MHSAKITQSLGPLLGAHTGGGILSLVYFAVGNFAKAAQKEIPHSDWNSAWRPNSNSTYAFRAH